MTIYPAIDLKEGKCVRLLQGDFNKKIVYDENPIAVAKQFLEAGATYMHIVDLDAAKTGIAVNAPIIQNIIKHFGIQVQIGGGIRALRDVEKHIEMGVSRVIIGTAAVKNRQMLQKAVEIYGAQIAVGLDAKNGRVAVSGWEEVTTETVEEMALQIAEIGVQNIIYTNIENDGMMSGTDIKGLKKLIQLTDVNIIASGGVATMEDLQQVKEAGAEGVIIGQALYKGALDLKTVIETFGGCR